MSQIASPKTAKLLIVSTVLLDAMGIGIIIPVLPSLLTDVLQDTSIGDAAIWGGVLASIFAIMQFIFSPILGTLSDEMGRKPVILLALGVMVFYYLTMAWAHSIWLLLFGRIVGGITAATHSTAAAFMADISKAEDKAKNFGIIGAGFGIGFVLGPVVGGLLGEVGPRAPFYAAAVLAGLNFALGLVFLPESVTDAIRKPFTWMRANPMGAFKEISKFDSLRPLLIVLLFYAIGTSVYPSIWPFFTAEKFDWEPGMIGVSLSIYGVCYAIVQGTLVAPCIRWFGERNTVLVGFGFEILAMVIITIVWHGWMLLAFIPLTSFGVVSTPAIQALMSRRIDDNSQGALQGVIGSLTAMSMIITPLVMTGLFSVFSDRTSGHYFPSAPFVAAGILIMICTVLFQRIPRLKNS